jgi:hypothetical protein
MCCNRHEDEVCREDRQVFEADSPRDLPTLGGKQTTAPFLRGKPQQVDLHDTDSKERHYRAKFSLELA